MTDNNHKAQTLAHYREWRMDTRARHALINAVNRKHGRPPRTMRETIRAHEAAHFRYHAAQWHDTAD